MLHAASSFIRRRTAVALSPTAGYRAWHKASTGITGNPNVTAIADLSANGLNYTAVNNPQLVASPSRITFASASTQHCTGAAISNFISKFQYTVFWVGKIVSVTTNNGTTPYANEAAFSDPGQYFGLHLRSTGIVQHYHWDTSVKKVDASFTIGQLSIFEIWYDGTHLHISVNGAAEPTPVAAGQVLVDSNPLHIARSTTVYSNLEFHEDFFYNTSLSAPDRLATRLYLAAEHGISL